MTEAERTNIMEAMYMPSLRKQRLFLCAICRRILHLANHENCQRAIDVAEMYADGKATSEQRQTAINGARTATRAATNAVDEAAKLAGQEASQYVEEARHSGKPNALIAGFCARIVCELPLWQRGEASEIKNLTVLALVNSTEAKWFGEVKNDVEELQAQQAILRDMECPSSTLVDHTWLAWRDGTILKLAQAIYDDRAFDRLPVLADALEEAGCHDADILAHCRAPGPHVRGCWVVDLLLGKV